MPPRIATTALSENDGSKTASVRRRTATPTATRTTISRMMSIMLNASQALPPSLTLNEPVAAADVDLEPVEEHEDEEKDCRPAGDLLPRTEPVHLSPPRNWGGSFDPIRAPGGAFDASGRVSYPAVVRMRAACSVFESSIAIVIGPTPPGTGVIAAATSAAAS